MAGPQYVAPKGGRPPQTDLLTDRAVFTEAYAVIPKGVMRDIVASYLPFWEKTRVWILSRPLSGFAETFSQYIMEVEPGGGSEQAGAGRRRGRRAFRHGRRGHGQARPQEPSPAAGRLRLPATVAAAGR